MELGRPLVKLPIGFDAQALEVGFSVDADVEQLDRGHAVVPVRDAVGAAEDDRRGVLLRLDLAFRRKAHAHELRAESVAELGLRQQEHVVGPAPPDEDGRDHPRLRRQQQCVDRARVRDVVRQHPVQILDRVRPLHPHVRAGPARCALRNGGHLSLD